MMRAVERDSSTNASESGRVPPEEMSGGSQRKLPDPQRLEALVFDRLLTWCPNVCTIFVGENVRSSQAGRQKLPQCAVNV